MKTCSNSSPNYLKDAAKAIQHRVKVRRHARKNFLAFVQLVWWRPWGFMVGRHTREICKIVDKAIDDFLAGKSSNLDIVVPFRHGKSDLISRALPPYFLGRCMEANKDPDIIMSGYAADLVEGFSKDCKHIIASPAYQELFPDVKIPRGDNSVQSWKIQGGTGRVTATGLGGALTGKGGHLIIIDDYCKNRAEARSKAYRNATWAAFQDIISRRAPVSIVIICATPWHVDDIRGRIKRECAKNKDFPRFDIVKFPARDPKTGKFLFPEWFSDQWYLEQYAAQASLAAALLDCAPVVEGGNRFKVDKIKKHFNLSEVPHGKFLRTWDLASSKKERDSDDPDWTVGILGTVVHEMVERDGLRIYRSELWIIDMVFIQAEAPERNRLIIETTAKDGPSVPIEVESFGAYKDTLAEIELVLKGLRSVSGSQLPGDKSAKCAPLESVFETGNVHIMDGEWNDFFIQCFREFPDGDHDDPCDATAILFHHFMEDQAGLAIPGQGRLDPSSDPNAIFAN